MIITWRVSSLLKNTINHPCFNRWTHLRTPEHHSSPWAITVCRIIPSNLVISPQLRTEYIMSAWGRLIHGVCFHCILNHSRPTLTMSLNCQRADIFMPDIWIFCPTPLILVQHNAEWGTGEGRRRRVGVCRLMCSYSIQSKISLLALMCYLKTLPPPYAWFPLREGNHAHTHTHA